MSVTPLTGLTASRSGSAARLSLAQQGRGGEDASPVRTTGMLGRKHEEPQKPSACYGLPLAEAGKVEPYLGSVSKLCSISTLLPDNKDVSVMMSEMDVNAIAGTLKLYFRELPEPLFTDEFYPNFAEGIGEHGRSPQPLLSSGTLRRERCQQQGGDELCPLHHGPPLSPNLVGGSRQRT